MPANYLHGFETLEKKTGRRSIRAVKSAVIALIGTAPRGPVNVLTQCLSDRDAARFGEDLPGFTMPSAFNGIHDQGAGTILAVNVLDPAKHRAAVTGEYARFGSDGVLRLNYGPVLRVSRISDQSGEKIYAPDRDYFEVRDIDDLRSPPRGFTRGSSGDIPPDAYVRVDYEYADPSLVTAADIIGGVDAAGRRTGLAALEDAYNLFGYFPKILIAPGFVTAQAVSTALVATAEKYRAQALVDAPIGVTPAQAIAGRGPRGDINFNTSSERAILCYPHLRIYDRTANATRLEPMSPRLAGVIAAQDLENGYWWSPSNTEIRGIVGMERPLTARLDDPHSEVNALNETGIVTVFNSFGTGLRVWGNRNAAWPSSTAMSTFINVRRARDIIDESIRFSALQFVDRPVTQALIDAVVESVKQFIDKLIGDDALIGGDCWFSLARNPTSELALGHATFSYRVTVPLPLERGTFETEITGEYLATFRGGE